jgi:radical SAM superfamily enzyme YgiQ (UPF0313 family)
MKILWIVKAIEFIDPLGIMLLSALAKQEGHECHLGILSRENVLEKIDRLKPDLVAYSASTGEHKYYLEFNDVLKSRNKDLFTVMGGPHTTFYPECIKGSSFDAICEGEGEEAFLELLACLENGRDISGIKNIIAKNGVSNGTRQLYSDLDSLPFPDRSLFYDNTEMGQFPLKSFMASRGCPYPCTYCFNHAFREMYKGKGRVIRRHSVEHIIGEILEVKKRYALDCVKFYDDIFVYEVDEWFLEFVDRYKKEIALPFHCLTRATLATEDVVKLLKEAGCFSISMSIESGNSDLRNQILKRKMSDEEIIKAFHLCKKYDIKTFSNNILALPFSTIENDVETLDLNIKCKVSFAEFPIFHPYPKTELGNLCIEKGLYDTKYEALHMSYMNRSPLSCFSEKEKNIQKNLSELGLLVVWFPSLRNLVVQYLIYLPHNRLFFYVYYLSKAYLVNTRIYPLKLGIGRLWKFFVMSLNLERFKHTNDRAIGRPEQKETSVDAKAAT